MTSKVKPGPLCEENRFWAVRIDGQNGPRLALNGNGGRALFRLRKDAELFCSELRDHLSSLCRVIQVDAVFSEVE